MEFRCQCCQRVVCRCPHVPSQRFCGRPRCQRERKRRWQAQRLAEDPDYRANEAAACRSWRQAHPGYWSAYRRNHPESAARNRQSQRLRNANRRARARGGASPPAGGDASLIANMDACRVGFPVVLSGRYRLVPETGPGIANMDASLVVELAVISKGFAPFSGLPHARPP